MGTRGNRIIYWNPKVGDGVFQMQKIDVDVAVLPMDYMYSSITQKSSLVEVRESATGEQ